jgi:hypothetical protein
MLRTWQPTKEKSMTRHRNGFNYAHFPVGTICEVHVNTYKSEPKVVEVTSLFKNGADSYVIETTTPGTVTEFFGCNIDHVTKIIKRGDGPVRFAPSPFKRTFHKDIAQELEYSYSKYGKHPSQYMTGDIRGLLLYVTDGLLTVDHMLDFEKFTNAVFDTGVFQKVSDDTTWMDFYKADKKRLKKVVRQLINKCLTSKKEALAFERDLDNKMMEQELDYLDRYEIDSGAEKEPAEASHYD